MQASQSLREAYSANPADLSDEELLRDFLYLKDTVQVVFSATNGILHSSDFDNTSLSTIVLRATAALESMRPVFDAMPVAEANQIRAAYTQRAQALDDHISASQQVCSMCLFIRLWSEESVLEVAQSYTAEVCRRNEAGQGEPTPWTDTLKRSRENGAL